MKSASVRQRLGPDAGMTIVELSVTGFLASIVLAALGAFLMSSFAAGTLTEGMSSTINDVRNATQSIEKETRGADSITWCEPKGSCLQVGAQTPTGSFQTLRYSHAGTELLREVFDPVTATWGTPLPVIERLTNTSSQPVFSCDRQTSLLRVTIDLYIEPTPRSDPSLNVQTSIRPRNFPSAANCPAGT